MIPKLIFYLVVGYLGVLAGSNIRYDWPWFDGRPPVGCHFLVATRPVAWTYRRTNVVLCWRVAALEP
jgi:hypothetical protein